MPGSFSGHGLALADRTLVAGDIAAGHLVLLNEGTLLNDRAMWLVFPETEYPDPRLTAFGDWVRSVVKELQEGVPPPFSQVSDPS